MRYSESKQTSAEILRIVLPHIAQSGSGFQPPSYAVWYEYASGMNPPLQEALNVRIADGRLLSHEETHGLYTKYIASRDAQQMERLQTQLQRTLDELAKLTSGASDETVNYGRTLQAYGDQLTPHLDVDGLRGIISALAAETAQMQESNTVLTERLEESQRDFIQLKIQLATVQNEALLDPLTGLKNRRGFQRGIDETLSSRSNGLIGCALLMADIDHFKKVNDTYGHLLGDKMLQSVAQTLMALVKGQDLIARFGGEEFAVLLPDTPTSGAVALAEKIRLTVAQGTIKKPGHDEPIGGVTISLGVAAYQPGESLEQWIARADQALYRSKQNGRNRVSVAAPGNTAPGQSASLLA